MRIFKLAAAALLGVARSASPAARPASRPRSRASRRCRRRRARASTSCRPTAQMAAGSNSPNMPAMVAQACSPKAMPRRPSPAAATLLVRSIMASTTGTTEIVSTAVTAVRLRSMAASMARPYYSRFGYGGYYGALATATRPSIMAGTIPFWYGGGSRQLHRLYQLSRPGHPPPRDGVAVRRPCQGALADRRAARCWCPIWSRRCSPASPAVRAKP